MLRHRGRDDALQQFLAARIDDGEAQTPDRVSHNAHADEAWN
jgi:hypothetical protein